MLLCFKHCHFLASTRVGILDVCGDYSCVGGGGSPQTPCAGWSWISSWGLLESLSWGLGGGGQLLKQTQPPGTVGYLSCINNEMVDMYSFTLKIHKSVGIDILLRVLFIWKADTHTHIHTPCRAFISCCIPQMPVTKRGPGKAI